VVAGDLSCDADLRILQRRNGRAHFGSPRFHAAPDAPEKVQLPRSIETGIVISLLAAAGRDTRQLTFACLCLRVTATGRDRGAQIEARSSPQGAYPPQVGGRDADVMVRGERLLHQAVEQRIVE